MTTQIPVSISFDEVITAHNIFVRTWDSTMSALPFNGGGLWYFDGAFYWKANTSKLIKRNK